MQAISLDRQPSGSSTGIGGFPPLSFSLVIWAGQYANSSRSAFPSIIFIESTYGDRLHDDEEDRRKEMAKKLVQHAIQHKSKIIVPAFSVGRIQDIIMRIKELVKNGEVDPIPIFIDSPLALKATKVFRQHPECYDEEAY
jgi:Cft2 family RNA processing exonuclease